FYLPAASQISGTHLWRLSDETNPYKFQARGVYNKTKAVKGKAALVQDKDTQAVKALIQPGYITNLTSTLKLPSARLYAGTNAKLSIKDNYFLNLNAEMILNPNLENEPNSGQSIAVLLPRASSLGMKLGVDLPLFGHPQSFAKSDNNDKNTGIAVSVLCDVYILQKTTLWYEGTDLQNGSYGSWHFNPALRVIIAKSFLSVDVGYNYLNPRYNRDALIKGVPSFAGITSFQYFNIRANTVLKLNDDENSFINVYMNFILDGLDVGSLQPTEKKLAVTPMLTFTYAALAELSR
ncbi:MAG: hypothetical protein ACPGLV_12765, partial [Bacteroidia bacterium]